MMKNITLFILVVFLISACNKQEDTIKTYRLAKETSAPLEAPSLPPTSPALSNAPQLPEMAPAASSNEIEWKVPVGWKTQPASPMRVGSFLIIGDNGQQADVSVIPLSGMAGGDLANVNRWRDQIDLPPLSESELPKTLQTLKLSAGPFQMVNFVSEKSLIDGKYKKRVVAATLKRGERTWFFKMIGEDQTVQKSKQKFIDFLSSVRLKDNEPH